MFLAKNVFIALAQYKTVTSYADATNRHVKCYFFQYEGVKTIMKA